VTFLHEGSSYYRGDFLIPERTEEILERLFFYLSRKRGWEMATFAGIPEDSRTAAILERVARRCGLSTGSWHPFGRALFLPIQGAWDDYLTRQGRHFRKHVWERERKLNALGKVESLTFRDPGSVKKAIEQLYDIQMKNRKAEGLEIPESDLSSRSAALRLAGLFSNEGMAEVKILTLDEKPVAGLFSIVYKGCSYAIIIKYDKEYASVSPGMTVLYHYVRDAWAQKADRIDFLMDWPYVERWTDQAKQYLKIDCFHPGPLSQGIRYSKRVDTWLRRGRSS
jgi:CelD/BcsL family acetyltransferase involved in cellulose biosynthesis